MGTGTADTELGAVSEATAFLYYFKDLPDHRQRGKVYYPLDEVLLLCLLAVLAGAETVTDIALFGCKKLELLRRFRPFVHGRGPDVRRLYAQFSGHRLREHSGVTAPGIV